MEQLIVVKARQQYRERAAPPEHIHAKARALVVDIVPEGAK